MVNQERRSGREEWEGGVAGSANLGGIAEEESSGGGGC
jgi:hypothetical protein